MENKTSKYFKYAIGEIILVVIGILIALQINNWNEKQKLEEKTQDYYKQILADLESDIKITESTINDFSLYLSRYKDYLDSYNNKELTPKRAYEQISKLNMITIPFTFNTSTIESLQNSGDISLIPSQIRNKLIDLKRHQGLITRRNELVADGKTGLIQKLTPLIGSTTLPERLKNTPKIKEVLKIEENIKELILVYEGVHRWKSVIEKETIDRLEKMLIEIKTIAMLINKELKT